jgi:hypothetical protein
VFALGLLLFALGCGSNGTFVPVKGPFSKSSLKGSYTYTLYGFDTTPASFSEAGVFTADGNGNITSGTDDFSENGSFVSNPITGTYNVLPDGSGLITFTLTGVAPPNTFQFAINLVSTSQLYLAENDTFANGAGVADLQVPSAITTTPSGMFALKVHAYQTLNGPVGTIGQVVSNAGVVQGTANILRSGALSAVTLTGQFGAPDATGRGQFKYTDSVTNISTNYQYYIINSTTVRLLGTDGSVLSQGRLEGQSGLPFSGMSLSGNYAFGSVGSLLSNNDGGLSRTVGTFTASGGGVSTGAFDSVVNGTVFSNNAVESGAYTVNANGQVQLTLNPSGGTPVQEVLWLVSPSRAFLLVNDPTKVEDGTVDLEQSSSFSNSSLNQQSAIYMEGLVINTNFLTRVGTFIPNGNGGVTLNEVVNAFTPSTGAILNMPSLSGSYTVGSNGRVTGTFNVSPSNIDFVIYLVAPNTGYILQNDTGVQVSGQLALQTSP